MAGVSLSLLVLKTRQLEGLRRFYAALGIDLRREQHGKGPIHYAGQIGDTVLELYPLVSEGGAEGPTRIGFKVPTVKGAVEALEALGTPVVTRPRTEWGLQALVRDPDGRAVELSQS
jgi:lactoylglutathione lyase